MNYDKLGENILH